jgi:hypothetical protein
VAEELLLEEFQTEEPGVAGWLLGPAMPCPAGRAPDYAEATPARSGWETMGPAPDDHLGYRGSSESILPRVRRCGLRFVIRSASLLRLEVRESEGMGILGIHDGPHRRTGIVGRGCPLGAGSKRPIIVDRSQLSAPCFAIALERRVIHQPLILGVGPLTYPGGGILEFLCAPGRARSHRSATNPRPPRTSQIARSPAMGPIRTART